MEIKFKPLLIPLLVSLASCEPEPKSFGVLAIQKRPDGYACSIEAIITNTNDSKIITFTVEIKSVKNARKSSKEVTVLPGATKSIVEACGLKFAIKGAFYEKENSKRVKTD
jgi:hypothetical protein